MLHQKNKQAEERILIRWEAEKMVREKVFGSRELSYFNIRICQRTNHFATVFEQALSASFDPGMRHPFLMTILHQKRAAKKVFGFLPESDCILRVLILSCLNNVLFERIDIDPEARLIS
ncbi:hypothetical protein KSB_76990 [Ktedonobacter robiniae]|uniref:Uncharacterized protein n=1 Tax=Ktedonobacter robiniae TaxID=2778365 RepID=A0ABQ3V236_9CHLR|nr:hypothetical protein KSB_76990 [Ktedonobacter robiniae]